MKKNKYIFLILCLIAVLSICSFGLFGCKSTDDSTTTAPINPSYTDINIYVPDGATLLTVAKILSEGYTLDGYNIKIHKVSGGDIALKISQGEADIAVAPTNVMAKLYNKGIDIKLVSANIYGLMYLVGQYDLSSLKDLEGQTVYTIGTGATPELIFRYVLQQNSVDLTKIDFQPKKDASEILPLLINGSAKFALLGEPAATMATVKASSKGIKIICDLQSEWAKINPSAGYPQAGICASGSMITKHYDALTSILSQVKSSVEWSETHLDEINNVLTSLESTVKIPSLAVLQNCNFKYESAMQAKDNLTKYFEVINEFDNTSIGGKLPDADFFYEVKV